MVKNPSTVNPWLIYVNVWQKPLQYCKVISLQLIKINEKKFIYQYRGHRLESWPKKIPHVVEKLNPCATTTEPAFCATTTEPKYPRARSVSRV